MNEFLFNILDGIRGWVGSWGWSMVVFTVLIRLVLTPLDIKSHVSMRKTQKLQPQMQALQKKYANDKEKLNAKTAELYKKEHVNPLSSCLPLLLTWPILIAVFGAMRLAANKELLIQVGQILNNEVPTLERWLWIKNLWMPDSLFAASMPDLNTLRQIPTDQWLAWFNSWGNVPAAISSLGLTADSFNPENLKGTVELIQAALEKISSAEWQAWMGSIDPAHLPEAIQALGLTAESFNPAILPDTLSSIKAALGTLTDTDWTTWVNQIWVDNAPLLAKDLNLTRDSFSQANLAATIERLVDIMGQNASYEDAMKAGMTFELLIARPAMMVVFNGLMILPIMSAASQLLMTKIMGGNQQPANEQGPGAGTGKFMKWFFPIFSLVICFSYSAAFALYWVAGNLVSMVQTFVINKVLDNKEKAAANMAGEGLQK